MARKPKDPSAPKRGRGGKALNAATAIAEAKAAQEKQIDTTLAMPSTNDVKNLARKCRSLKKQGLEITGGIGQAIAEAAEKKNLDKSAFGIARRLESMSDEKLHVTYHHLLKYMDDMNITKRATAQGRMDVDVEQNDDSETDASRGGFKVVEGGRPTEEQAGAA